MTKHALLCGVFVAAFGPSAQVYAQSAPSTPSAASSGETQAGLADIVVTAQRREERLQNVPVAVTAFTSEALAARQIVDAKADTRLAPNVAFATAPSDPTDAEIGIRGIITSDSMLIADLSVPVYVDGVYLARSTGTNAAFIDMDRVEVLRGPQGTLFGRNTTGGALNVTTKKPTDRFEGLIDGGFGNYSSRLFDGVLNAPLGKDAAVRLVYQHNEHGPFGHSLATGAGLDSINQNYFRGTLRYDFSPDWQLIATGDYLKATGGGSATKLGYFSPTLSLGGGLPPLNQFVPTLQGNPTDLISNYVNRGGYHDNYSDLTTRFSIRTYSGTGTLSGRIGDISLKSITAYRNIVALRPTDYDGTPYALENLPTQPLTQHQFSEEFQLYGDALDGRLHYIAGAYYFIEKGRSQADVVLFGNLVDSVIDFNATNISLGTFAQASYEITPQLKLTGGIRYTKDIRKVDYHDGTRDLATGAFTCGLNPAVRSGPGCDAPGKVKFSYVPFTAGIDFKPNDDVLLYAKVSKGYRSGGFPQSSNSTLTVLTHDTPENVLSPEAGAKVTLLDRHLIVNSAIFYSRYSKIQQQIPSVVNGIPVQLQSNVGDARIYGLEMEVTALIQNLRLSAGLGIIDPKYTAGPLKNGPFLYASRRTFSFAADYSIDTGVGKLTVGGDYSYRSKVFYQPLTGIPGVDATTSQKAYGLINGKMSLEIAQFPGLTASVYGRNLANKDYKTRGLEFTTSTGEAVFFPGDPRTFGGMLSYRF